MRLILAILGVVLTMSSLLLMHRIPSRGYSGSAPKQLPKRPEGPAASVNPKAPRPVGPERW